jgi:hypothetical protein
MLYSSSRCCTPLLAAAMALALGACGDSTGPHKTLDVQIALTSTGGPTISSDANGTQQLTCQLNFSLTAAGNVSATWDNAVYRFYVGKNRTTPADTLVISSDDIVRGWGTPITPGETKQSTWNVAATVPFAGEIEFRYRPEGGGVKGAKVAFECAPPGATTAAPPTITSLSIQPPSGELPAGAPVNVSFDVAAPAGLWQLSLSVSGPCTYQRKIDEQLQTTLTQTLVVQLPNSCQLNVPLTVTVAALDAALQTRSKTLATSLVIVDKQPPVVTPLFFPPDGGSAKTTLSGDYFGGDSIGFLPNATDNHALAAIIWEILPYGTKDSVVVSGQPAPWTIYAHLRPEWSGPVQLRVYARDAVGLTSNVVTTQADSVRVHPEIDRPTRTTTVSGETRDIAIDSRRGVIYLRQGNDHRIALLSMSTLQVTATVPLPAVPADFDLTPSGDSLLVLLYGQPQIDVVDLTQPSLTVSSLPLTVDASLGQVPVGLRVGSNGKAYVTFGGNGTTARTLAEVDLATHAQRTRSDAGIGGNTGVGSLQASLDRSVLMLNTTDPACMQRFVIQTNTFGPCVRPAVIDWPPTVDATGSRFAVGLDIYDESMRLLPKAAGKPLVSGIPVTALSANGDVLFVSLWNLGFVRLRTTDSGILDRTPNPVKPSLVRLAPDGNTLVSVESNFGTTTKISLIDVR